MLSENTTKVAGRLKLFSHEWGQITSDRYILDAINHYMIEFSDIPLGTVDISDAYYSIPVDESQQKYLKFLFNGKLLKFTCLPQGLSCAPRCFTKVMKPVLATLRKRGYLNVGYIDDIYVQGDTYEEWLNNINDTVALLSRLGFIIHPEKSTRKPVQRIQFLGFTLDSVRMIVVPIQDKKAKLKSA